VGSVVTGTVVAESLRVGTDLNVLITGLPRGGAMEHGRQATLWCGRREVGCPDGEANLLAAELAQTLEPGPWYGVWPGHGRLRYIVFSSFGYATDASCRALQLHLERHHTSTGREQLQIRRSQGRGA
jgi:hypothetical protein